MEKIKCVRCGTENETDYTFCKNCGAVLPKVEKKFDGVGPAAYMPPQPQVTTIDYDGVSGQEMSAYIKTNVDKILPKMQTMQLQNKKTAWSWPVFLLGFFFGFIGISCWCFYRKMVKWGLIALACAVVLTTADLAVNYGSIKTLMQDYIGTVMVLVESDSFREVDDDLTLGEFREQYEDTMDEYIDDLVEETETFMRSYRGIFGRLNSLLGRLVCPILMGLFGLYLYKQKAVRDIMGLRQTSSADPLYWVRLSSKGGTSGGLVVIPVAVSFLMGFVILGVFFSMFFSIAETTLLTL